MKPDSFRAATAREIGRELADRPPLRSIPRPADAAMPQRTLTDVHDALRTWFGPEYDLDAIDTVLVTAAVERLDGDPLWLLIISGSGAAKTETTQSLGGSGAIVTSTITSEGALLSGTPNREK